MRVELVGIESYELEEESDRVTICKGVPLLTARLRRVVLGAFEVYTLLCLE